MSDGLPGVAAKLRECRGRAGILIADVAGHRVTDAVIAAILHQAFLLGVYYELDRFGEVTTKLFEHLNQRFFRTTAVNRYLTMLYGEISVGGSFRFISAGHPPPLLFSRRRKTLEPAGGDNVVTFPPVGMFASRGALDERVEPGWLGYKDPYTVNQVELLDDGDLLLLATDGLVEHLDGAHFPAAVERSLVRLADADAAQVCRSLWQDLVAAGEPTDDVSLVVIKKTAS